MHISALIIVGSLAIAAGLLVYLLYKKLLREIPGVIFRFGKTWGRTTDSYRVLRVLNTIFYITGMTVILAGIIIGISRYTKPFPLPTPPVAVQQTDDILDPNEILKLVNSERKKHGLKELVSDPDLTAVAQERVNDMVQNQYYAHLNLQGKFYYQLFAAHGFKTGYSCENLDVEFTLDERQYIDDWLLSTKGHRECLLNIDVTKAGYAIGDFSNSGGHSTMQSYIVVGIHAAPPFRTIEKSAATKTSQ